MRTLFLILSLLMAAPWSLAADYVREQRWADEILPGVLDADPVWLQQANGHKFLALYTTAAKPRGAVVLVHGTGVHPDWGVIGALRSRLPEQGYATLSLQMPVLAADAPSEAYPPTFPEAAERISRAVAWLQAQGQTRIAIVSHSLGGRMVRAYLLEQPASPVRAWAALSMGGDDFNGIKVPVLDVYAEQDFPAVLGNLDAHRRSLANAASLQRMQPASNHFYEGREAEVIALVREWLDKAP